LKHCTCSNVNDLGEVSEVEANCIIRVWVRWFVFRSDRRKGAEREGKREGERERESVCVCVCVREREREREGERKGGREERRERERESLNVVET